MTASATSSGSKARRRWPRALMWVFGLALAMLVLAVLLIPMLVPVPPLTGTVPPVELKDAQSRFTIIDGNIVHYRLWGSADSSQTILLLHGFGASTFSWRDVGPLLGRKYKVVAIDRTGFGLTERPLPPTPWAWQKDSPYSYQAQAETAFSLLDQLNVPRAAIVGHSQGAAVAVAMAVDSPQRVTALVLVAPAVNNGGVPQWIAPVLRTPQGRWFGRLFVRRIASSGTDAILARAYADPSTLTPAVIEGYRKPLRAQNWDVGLWEMTIAPQPLRPADELASLAGVPTLVIVPQQDRIVAPAEQEQLASKIPGARVAAVAGQNHLYHEEQPAAFVATVQKFVGNRR